MPASPNAPKPETQGCRPAVDHRGVGSQLRITVYVACAIALITAVIFVTQRAYDRYFAKPSQVCLKYRPGSYGVFNSCEEYGTR